MADKNLVKDVLNMFVLLNLQQLGLISENYKSCLIILFFVYVWKNKVTVFYHENFKNYWKKIMLQVFLSRVCYTWI